MLCICILFIILALTARAADDKNHFTNPSSWTGINPVWKLGEEQVIAWKTTLGEFNISFWQQSIFQQTAASQGNVYSKIHASDKVTNFTWTVQLYGFELDYSNVFYFWINSDTPNGFTSAYFNITEPDTTSTASSNTTSSSSIPAATDSSTSPLPQSAGNESSGLTNTGKIALGVGLGIGLPILGALMILLWQRFQPSTSKSEGSNTSLSDQTEPSAINGMKFPRSSPRELPGTTDPSLIYPELPSRPYI
ncbi:hypothetical protein BJX76DRAFT_348501 [Aspergillus varians]